MAAKPRERQLEADLRELLAPHFPGMEVSIEPASRWDRPVVIFRCPAFANLLPEERYERLLRFISEPFRTAHMRGLIWLELAEGESVDAFLKLPRSEDAAEREGDIYARLQSAGFFEALKKSLGRAPTKSCKSDFSDSVAILAERRPPSPSIEEAKLLFIRHGAYCDCQALLTVAPQLAKAHPEATKNS